MNKKRNLNAVDPNTLAAIAQPVSDIVGNIFNCDNGCRIKHPFNKGRRYECFEQCKSHELAMAQAGTSHNYTMYAPGSGGSGGSGVNQAGMLGGLNNQTTLLIGAGLLAWIVIQNRK